MLIYKLQIYFPDHRFFMDYKKLNNKTEFKFQKIEVFFKSYLIINPQYIHFL